MTFLLALQGWEHGGWVDAFRTNMPGREVVLHTDDFDKNAVTYACAWQPPEGIFQGLPNLKAIFSLGAGVDSLLKDKTLPDVPIVRSVSENLTGRMTEYVCQHVLMHHRRHRLYDAQQKERLWREHAQPAAADVRVGIMGLGVLGQDAAEKLVAIGFDVAGWSRSAKAVPNVECFAGEDGLGPFLARTDILVVLLPHTPDTEGMLTYELFSSLARDGALPDDFPVLINAGRGKLQVEADILKALGDGTLKGASLDVFETEPLGAESKLWAHPLVTITPHIAAESDPTALTRYIAEQIRAHERGAPLRNVVDRARGY